MEQINRIKIENIKGKKCFEIKFSNLIANQPNIIVAPNGYGKSTIATAFKNAMHGKMKLDAADIYGQDQTNKPCLEIELSGEKEGTYIATDECNSISQNIFIWVINSSLYAKSISRRYNQRTITSAELRVEDIVIYENIPPKKEINYSYRDVKSKFGKRGKLFFNIENMLNNFENINRLCEIGKELKKCITQITISNKLKEFLNNCPDSGSAMNIKSNISLESIDALRTNKNIAALFDSIIDMQNKPKDWQKVDVVFSAIQICEVLKYHCDNGENNILTKLQKYLEYKAEKNLLNERLEEFNTTGREIKAHEDHGKLIVRFNKAKSMSNGERDILSFVVNLTCAEYHFRKEIGILIIDEIFDYLDGSNMLAVQYYLSEYIKKCKSNKKILYPIIFTHLDPEVFSNYYFNKKKIHYISFSSDINMKSFIVKMLRLRESGSLSQDEKQQIEKYYIHYNSKEYSMLHDLAVKIDRDFSDSNYQFRKQLYDEIREKYLLDKKYDPVMVIAGVRIRIEELVFNKLEENDKENFIKQHKVINKLNYASSKGIESPELYYLLQPLYNDGLHLGGNEDCVRRKIKSCYLKTNNLHIKNMIEQLFY